jgi:hypothetical protein
VRRRTFAGRTAAALGTLVAAGTAALAMAPAAAAEDWCDMDPRLPVVTPGGSRQDVYVTVGALGSTHRRALHQAAIGWTAKSITGGTEVTITVTVPLDESQTPDRTGARSADRTPFPTRAVVSTQPYGKGTVLARKDDGKAGTEMRLTYSLNVA